MFGSGHSSSKEHCMYVLEREVQPQLTCIHLINPARSRRPAAFVAVLTVLTQPKAASSKSSNRRPRHRCQNESQRGQTETVREVKSCRGAVSQTITHTSTCSWRLAIKAVMSPALRTSSTPHPLNPQKEPACKIGFLFAILQTQSKPPWHTR